MPLPDDYHPKRGDVLLIHAVVHYDAEVGEPLHLYTPGRTYSRFTADVTDVHSVMSRSWKSADRVQVVRPAGSPDCERTVGTVLATDGPTVWVRLDDGSYQTYRSINLEPVPDESFVAEAPPFEPVPNDPDDVKPFP